MCVRARVAAKQLGLLGRAATLRFETAALQDLFKTQPVAIKSTLWHMFGHHMSSLQSKEGWVRRWITERTIFYCQSALFNAAPARVMYTNNPSVGTLVSKAFAQRFAL